jgi:hypothetical protein
MVSDLQKQFLGASDQIAFVSIQSRVNGTSSYTAGSDLTSVGVAPAAPNTAPVLDNGFKLG